MGFYSFYRIFKDIIKSIFGNKSWRLTLIICLVLLVIILFNNKVNASDLRPWNVYNNTTEFNWSRLTNMNFTSSSLPYKMYEIKPDETYYLYNPNSNTGTIHYYCYTSNDVDRPQILIEDTSYQAALHLDYNFEFPSGYIDIPYNVPFTPQMTFYVFITDSCELYLFDDKYSNIEAYNEIMETKELLKSLVGVEGDGVNADYFIVDGLCASLTNKFVSSSNFTTIYFPVKNGYNYSISFDYTNNRYDLIRCGYVSTIPAVDVTFSSVSTWDSFNYSNPIEFTSNANTYYFVSYYNQLASNFKVTNNQNLLTDINNQAQQTRETLTDSNISQNSSDYSLPTDSTNDITASGFASIFDRIKNTFTSPTSTPIVITVPFTGKSFTISKQTVYGSANLGIVQTLIECFWWYIISLFVCKDVFKKIEKLKTGNIEFTETTNIKEDIL